MEITINNHNDLLGLSKLNGLINRPYLESLSFPFLDNSEEQKKSEKIISLFNDCACKWGAISFLLTMLVFTAFYGYSDFKLIPFLLQGLGISLGISVATKISILIYHHFIINKLLNRITGKFIEHHLTKS